MTKKRNWKKISAGVGLGLLTAAALGYAAYKLKNRRDLGSELYKARRRLAQTNPRHLQRVINKEYKHKKKT